MKKEFMFVLLLLFSIQLVVSQEKFEGIPIDDFPKYTYESILKRKGCKFDFFETEEDAVQYAKLLFQQDKHTDKQKDYDLAAYDEGEDWMICIYEKHSTENHGDVITDTLDGTEYIIIFKKKTGEIIRFERY